MVSVPVEGLWSLRSVGDTDLREVIAFLERERLINIYLSSRLLDDPIVAAAQMVAVRYQNEIVVVAALATNVVIAGAPDAPPQVLGSAIDLVANRIIGQLLPVRAIISPAHLVETLWSRLRTRVDPPTVVRMNQPVYALTPRAGLPDLGRARFSTRYDLDRLVPACAAMHREEVGIDPLERDAAGYRERIRELAELRRSIVLEMDGEIAAKCEFSAVTDSAVQLMGVWTHPRFRRRGLAAELLRETCGHIFLSGKTVTLFVNDFNTPAIALYESLGFERIGVNRALIW
jgi:RimJ/RimL family protein N-acetyltransferase